MPSLHLIQLHFISYATFDFSSFIFMMTSKKMVAKSSGSTNLNKWCNISSLNNIITYSIAHYLRRCNEILCFLFIFYVCKCISWLFPKINKVIIINTFLFTAIHYRQMAAVPSFLYMKACDLHEDNISSSFVWYILMDIT